MVYSVAIKLGPRGCKIFHYTGCDDKFEAINVKPNWTCLSLLDRNEILNPLRSLGRSFDDRIVQEDIELWPNQVINQNNKPMFQVGQKWNQTTTFHSAEEIVAWMLEAGKNKIEEKGGERSYSAILIVPNDFNESQQEATQAAIKLSGIEVTETISHSTAVGYSFNALCNQNKHDGENEYTDSICSFSLPRTPEGGRYLFVHLGSYSLDVTVINFDEENELIEIESESGDSRLGSINFTRRMDRAIREFCQQQNVTCERNWIPWKLHLNLTGKDETRLISLQYEDFLVQCERDNLEEDILQLTEALERASDPYFVHEQLNKKKRKLEQLSPIDSSRCYQLTRAKFEKECSDLFERVAQQVEKAVKEASTDRASYKQVKLYGGAANSWPAITDIVDKILPNISVNHDEVPADLDSPDSCSFLSSFGRASYDLLGAACMAHVLGKKKHETNESQYYSSQFKHDTSSVLHRKARLIKKSMK